MGASRGLNAVAFTRQRIADIERLFAEGKKPDQVAASLGITRESLMDYIKAHGIAVPRWAGLHKVGYISSKDSIFIVTGAVDALVGAAQGLQLLNGFTVFALAREEARQLLNDARNALRPINALVAALKEAAK
jgi:hypothetical protein